MPKLENFTNRVEIDSYTFLKNELRPIDINGTDLVSVVYTGNTNASRNIANNLTQTAYTEWTDSGDNPYASKDALFSDMKAYFLKDEASSLDSGGQIDASGRLRVSELRSIIDVKQIHDEQPLFLDRENINGGTQVYNSAIGGTVLSAPSNGDVAISQTKITGTYFAGKSQLVELTFDNFQNETDITKRAGYFSSNIVAPFDSDKDGIWIEADGTDYRLIISKLGNEVINVTQSNWNLDPATWFDPSKFNIMVIQFLYLGGSSVKIGFFDQGIIKWVHQYNHAGINNGTFIKTPQQPVRYEVRSTGGTGSLNQICMTVASEGANGEVGKTTPVISEDYQANSNSTQYIVGGVRLKADYWDVRVNVQSISINATTNDDYIWYVVVNPSFNGSKAWSDLSFSSLQEFVPDSNNNTVTDLGIVVAAGSSQGNSSISAPIESKVSLGRNIDGLLDEGYLVIEPLSNGLDVTSIVTLREFL